MNWKNFFTQVAIWTTVSVVGGVILWKLTDGKKASGRARERNILPNGTQVRVTGSEVPAWLEKGAWTANPNGSERIAGAITGTVLGNHSETVESRAATPGGAESVTRVHNTYYRVEVASPAVIGTPTPPRTLWVNGNALETITAREAAGSIINNARARVGL